MKKQTNKSLWFGGFVTFLALAVIVAMVSRNWLPKVVAETLTVTDCAFSTDSIELDKGQTVRLTVKADQDGTFTIDNYNISKSVTANEARDISFKTARSGAFDAKLSGCEHHTTLMVRDDNGKLPSIEEHHGDDEAMEEMHDEGEHEHETEDDNSEHSE